MCRPMQLRLHDGAVKRYRTLTTPAAEITTTAPSAVSLAIRPSQAVGLAGARWWGEGQGGKGPKRRTAIGVRACCPDQVVVCKLHVSSSPRMLPPPCPDLHPQYLHLLSPFHFPMNCFQFLASRLEMSLAAAKYLDPSHCSFLPRCQTQQLALVTCVQESSCACCSAYLDLSSANRARGLEGSGACLDMVVSGLIG